MSICIAGMHRSGTSLVASLLHTLGVYLGDEVDFIEAKKGENTDGFWEHFGFYALNERLLLHLRAGWDAPWIPDGWEDREDLAPFREEARLLANRMKGLADGDGCWGWKDPRNSITIQFWRSLLPDAKVVICVRNPVEVTASLCARNNLSVAASSRLWLRYYENLLSHVPRGNRVITVYENYFDHFEQELGRVCAALGIKIGNGAMTQARARVKQDLRHNRATRQELCSGDYEPELIRLYDSLLEEAREGKGEAVAGPAAITPERNEVGPALNGDAFDIARSRFNAELAQREEHIHRLNHGNRMLKKQLDEFEERLDEFKGQLNGWEKQKAAQAPRLSAMAAKAIEAQSALGSRQDELMALQNKVLRHLKDKKTSMPRWIQRIKTLNFLYRSMKTIHKAVRLLLFQRNLNNAMVQHLHLLTQSVALMAQDSTQKSGSAPGLELGGTDKIMVDLSMLATLLRQRLT